MLFVVDANLPRSVTVLLVSLGHQAEFVRDVALAVARARRCAAGLPSGALHCREVGRQAKTPVARQVLVKSYPPATGTIQSNRINRGCRQCERRLWPAIDPQHPALRSWVRYAPETLDWHKGQEFPRSLHGSEHLPAE
jgi:hypothetical protein